jgi:hypothetical protein
MPMPEALAAAVPGAPPAAPLRLRAIALPIEHGGWGLLLEPLLVGRLIAPSWAGLGIAQLALFAYLARHPLKIAIGDWTQGRRYARTRAAERFALAYSAGALLGLPLATQGSAWWWTPLALAVPPALFQLVHDVRRRGRALLPELAGSAALGAVAAAAMIAGGADSAGAVAVWLLLSLKGAGAILYVRARLRCDRGSVIDRRPPVLAHVGLVAGALGLAATGLGPWLAVPAAAALLARAADGLSGRHAPQRPKAIGFRELGYGVAFALAVAIGCVFGI